MLLLFADFGFGLVLAVERRDEHQHAFVQPALGVVAASIQYSPAGSSGTPRSPGGVMK